MRRWIVLLGVALFVEPCVLEARGEAASGAERRTTDSAKVAKRSFARARVHADVAEEGKTDTLSNQDKAFLRGAEMSNVFQAQLEGLATQKSSRKDVQLTSKTLGGEQLKAEKPLADLAKSKGFLDLPTKLDDSHQRRYDEVKSLDGIAFDRKWTTLMIEEVQNEVDTFDHAKDRADDAQIRAFAGKMLPTLNDHLKSLKALDERLRSGTTG